MKPSPRKPGKTSAPAVILQQPAAKLPGNAEPNEIGPPTVTQLDTPAIPGEHRQRILLHSSVLLDELNEALAA